MHPADLAVSVESPSQPGCSGARFIKNINHSQSSVSASLIPIYCKLLLHSQLTSFTASHATSPDRNALLAQHFRSSGLPCRSSNRLELATGQSPWPGAQQQQLQTIAEDESISSLPLSTHSVVEMPHDSVLYKSITDTDTDTECIFVNYLLQLNITFNGLV